jgi:lipoprotein-anchoring transpeptidase ErfK/SrfK
MRVSLAIIGCFFATSASALSVNDIRNAEYNGTTPPSGQSGLTVTLQVLLDRAGVSPGVIDGYKGDMSTSALRGFEELKGFNVDGLLDDEVWNALGGNEAAPVIKSYEITSEDTTNLTSSIPDDVRKKADMDKLGYVRVTEKLAERFHMDEDFLIQLNPDTDFTAGSTINVTDVGPDAGETVTRIEIRKSDRRAVAFNAEGQMVTNYPVAIGSAETPSPEGSMEIEAIAIDPTYSYRPDVNFTADGVTESLTLPPGPNGPVGTVWLDLTKPTYGLHGTSTPSKLFVENSHGCVRFTNWDVTELANMVDAGTKVEFVE